MGSGDVCLSRPVGRRKPRAATLRGGRVSCNGMIGSCPAAQLTPRLRARNPMEQQQPTGGEVLAVPSGVHGEWRGCWSRTRCGRSITSCGSRALPGSRTTTCTR